MEKIKKMFSSKSSRNGTYSVGLAVIVIAIAIVINLVAGQLPEKVRNIDISSNNLYDISSVSTKMLKKLDKKVDLKVIAEQDSVDTRIKTFVKKYAALSGPSHAEEVARALPTTVVTASTAPDLAITVQDIFSTDRFRVYTNDDLIGVELGGALKNIIALGAGISDGLQLGDNTKVAMMTRGMTEMTRLGLALGAHAETFAGLAGIGDLIVTCTSMHSRNRRCGILIGQGKRVADAVKEVGMVVEGLSTAEAATALAQKYQVEMPITQCFYHMIQGSVNAAEAIDLLMGRERKKENIIL